MAGTPRATARRLPTFSVRAAGATSPVAIPYLTDDTHDTAGQGPIRVRNGSFGATLPAGSLVTYYLPARH